MQPRPIAVTRGPFLPNVRTGSCVIFSKMRVKIFNVSYWAVALKGAWGRSNIYVTEVRSQHIFVREEIP